MGVVLLAIDGCVILLAGLTMSAEHAMYSMICVFIFSVIIDKVLAGLGTDKACYVITNKPDRIAARLMAELDRGVTMLSGIGAYSGGAVQMLVCVVPRMQVMGVKDIVKEEDPVAFLFMTDTHETLGEGFRDLVEKES